jgi:hypothetical protein
MQEGVPGRVGRILGEATEHAQPVSKGWKTDKSKKISQLRGSDD